MKDDKDSIRALLGAVEYPREGDKYIVDLEIMSWPMEHPDAVVNCFCRNCAGYIEVGKQSANELCMLSGIEKREEYSDLFFTSGECPFCSDGYTNVKYYLLK